MAKQVNPARIIPITVQKYVILSGYRSQHHSQQRETGDCAPEVAKTATTGSAPDFVEDSSDRRATYRAVE